jgi:FlaA1/EpsC-like NDP-sugar epimerase
MELDLSGFVGRPRIPIDHSLAETAVHGKRVLITGGGGSIGSDFAFAALAARAQSLFLLDSSEHALYESHRRMALLAKDSATKVMPIVGSILDKNLLGHLFRQHRPELILHTAAYKHVPLMEQNPFSAMANNVVGTYTLITSALQNSVNQIIMVSTDKAVNPQSIMGASKRIAELVMLSHATPQVRMNSVRLGNVLGSSGSVVLLFQEQLEKGLPLTVTHADARRYFMTSSEALISLLRATTCTMSGRILLANCAPALRVLDLAHYIAQRYGTQTAQRPLIEFTGLRPGDKLEEELISSDETIEPQRAAGLRVIASPCPSAADVAASIERIEAAIRCVDKEELMSAVGDLIPGYCANRVAERATQYAGAE